MSTDESVVTFFLEDLVKEPLLADVCINSSFATSVSAVALVTGFVPTLPTAALAGIATGFCYCNHLDYVVREDLRKQGAKGIIIPY